MTGFLVGFVVGASVVGILVIVAGPTRRVRAETGIDDEIETRILLGIDPEPAAAAAEDDATIDHPRDYSAQDIKALEELAKHPKQRKG